LKNFIVRIARIDDLNELKKLFVETVTTVCSADYDEQQINAWTSGVDNRQRWDDIMTKQFVLVAQHADRIAGFATLDNGNYIDLLYVHKDYQRQGIANTLYADIETEARRLKQTTLTSDVSKTAKPFFEKVGFKVVKEQNVTIDNVEMTNYKMTKKLVN
jgi:putative acetyltransferase